VTAWIDNEQVLRMNVVPGLKEKKMSYERIPHFLGIDVGLKTDGTALAICHIVKKEVDGMVKDFVELDHIAVRYAADEGKEFFHPEEMAEWIASYMTKFYIVSGFMDQYYGLSILPVLHAKGHKQVQIVNVTRDLNSRIYQNLMTKMLNASLRIIEGEETIVDGKKTNDISLVTEMLRLKAVKHSKYLISVSAPEIKGVHDDESDAFARSVWLATEYMAKGGNTISKHTELSTKGTSQTYKKYYRKQKRMAGHTKRPTSALQMEIASRNFGTTGRR